MERGNVDAFRAPLPDMVAIRSSNAGCARAPSIVAVVFLSPLPKHPSFLVAIQ
jgi:hypothetical protein